MKFFKIALNERYLMIVNFIAVFYLYDNYLDAYTVTDNRLYNFFIDVALISLFSYIGTIVTLISIIVLIYTVFIKSHNPHYLSFFNKLETVAVAVEHVEEFETISELQVKFEQILLEKFGR